MERYCSTGQSPQRAVAPTEEEEATSIIAFINALLGAKLNVVHSPTVAW
jgi:hypothetical protein